MIKCIVKRVKVRTSNLSGKTKSKHPVLTKKFNLDRAIIMFL